eukprot:TRINITY_DN3971_c0_g1_i2.p1 TRINITY_DN3971_c0_g1~~TRINITY_DN3971_c0_g1_i2.p1  ORF type:complete len:165 (-),score=64.91 TRINITY_DN3971_c0_g1_i2:63-533(-)
MGSLILAVIMKCLIILTIACSVLGDADPQYPYGAGLLGHQHGHGLHGAGLLGHQYGYGGPYSYQPQAVPASVVDTPAATVRLAAPAPYTGYAGYALPYGYAHAGIHGYSGYAPHTGYAPHSALTGYAHPGAYRGYPGWPYAAAAATAPPASVQKKD